MASLSNKIALNTLAQLLGKVGTTGLGIVISAILGRYLGPEGLGTYTFVLVFVTLFGAVGDWGLTLITVREASRNLGKAAEIIGNVLVIRLGLATLAATAAIISIHLLPYSGPIKFLTSLASLYLIALSLKTSFQIVFQVHLKLHNSAISEISANATVLIILVPLVFLQAGLPAIILAFLAGDIVAATVAAILARRIIALKPSLIHSTTRALVIEALPMGGILAVFTIYNRVDTVILSLYKGQEAVGYYGAAYRIYEVLVLGAAYFANAVLPTLSRLAHTEPHRVRDFYKRSFVVLTFLGIGVAIVNFVLSPLAIYITVGSQFAPSVTPLRILSLALVVSYFNHLNGYTIIALGKQWHSFAIAVIALIFNVSLNFLVIPSYSYAGAALITFTTEAVIVILSLAVVSRFVGGSVLPSPKEFVSLVREFIAKRGQVFNDHDQ